MLDSLNSGDYVDKNKLMSGWKRAFGDFSLLLKTFRLYVSSLGDHGTAGEKLLPANKPVGAQFLNQLRSLRS